MKQITLVHFSDAPADGSLPVFTPPIGLWSMRTNALENTDVNIFDMNIQEIPECKTEVVGYSIMFPTQTRFIKDVQKKITAESQIMGGPTGGSIAIDGILPIRGSGEAYLRGHPMKFCDILPPTFDTKEMGPYWTLGRPFSGIAPIGKWMPVETSRGCPNRCGFCAIPYLWGNWQARPVDMMDKYFHYLKKVHGVEEIIVIDDNIAVSISRFLEIIDLFKKYKLSWHVSNGIYTRALMDKSVQKALRGSRCRFLSIPFEAGNQRSADLMNLGRKYLSFEEAYMMTIVTKELGIHTAGQFIVGYPGETEQNVRDTLQYANKINLDERHIHIAMPLPNTPMYNECKDNKWLLKEGENYKTAVIETPKLAAAELYRIWKEDRDEALARKE